MHWDLVKQMAEVVASQAAGALAVAEAAAADGIEAAAAADHHTADRTAAVAAAAVVKIDVAIDVVQHNLMSHRTMVLLWEPVERALMSHSKVLTAGRYCRTVRRCCMHLMQAVDVRRRNMAEPAAAAAAAGTTMALRKRDRHGCRTWRRASKVGLGKRQEEMFTPQTRVCITSVWAEDQSLLQPGRRDALAQWRFSS